MRSCVVFNLVLNKLKSRQADRIERQVVRSASIRDRQRVCTRVFEWRQPLPKQRTNAFIPLHVNPANLAGAVIEIEVTTELLVFRFRNERWTSRSRTIAIAVAASHAVVYSACRGCC